MKMLGLILALYVAAAVQTSVADSLAIGPIVPEFLPALALMLVLYRPVTSSLVAAGAIGLLADLLGPGRVGPGGAALVLVGMALQAALARVGRNALVRGLLLLVGLAGWGAIDALAGRWLGAPALPIGALLGRVLAMAGLTTLLCAPVLLVVHWLTPGRLHAPAGLA